MKKCSIKPMFKSKECFGPMLGSNSDCCFQFYKHQPIEKPGF